jgi:hypothetical protein
MWRHFAGSCHGRVAHLDLSGTGLHASLKARPQTTTLNLHRSASLSKLICNAKLHPDSVSLE